MNEMKAQDPSLVSRAKILGFPNLLYDNQWIIFNKARMFGWQGSQPAVLGNHAANKALEEAVDFLLAQGVNFRKEGKI